MRCVGCEMEPVTSAHYCEGCGSRLSSYETAATFESPASGPDPWAPDRDPTEVGRCDSCGGPNANGDLCGSCQRAFFSSWLESAAPAAPVSDTTMAVADAATSQERLAARTEDLAAFDATPDFHGGLPAFAFEPSASVSAPPYTATPAEVAVPAPVVSDATMTSVDDAVAAAKANAEAVRAEEAGAKARCDATHVESAAKPAAAKRLDVPLPSSRRHPSIALAGTAVVVAAIGVGAYWLRFHEQPVIAREDQPTLAASNLTVTRRKPPASGLSAAPIAGDTSAETPPEVPVSARPKPALPAPAPVAAKPVRAPALATRQIAPIFVPAAPVPAVEPSISNVVAVAPPTEPPSPPVGRFFETTDVNELPQVATRVEPQLPDEFRSRPLNEIVIVRVLVSQGGHPSQISLLRRSKAGPRLDNAVIAAVNQWTFSPARKRGAAVSCWFNFGVPITGAD